MYNDFMGLFRWSDGPNGGPGMTQLYIEAMDAIYEARSKYHMAVKCSAIITTPILSS